MSLFSFSKIGLQPFPGLQGESTLEPSWLAQEILVSNDHVLTSSLTQILLTDYKSVMRASLMIGCGHSIMQG